MKDNAKMQLLFFFSTNVNINVSSSIWRQSERERGGDSINNNFFFWLHHRKYILIWRWRSHISQMGMKTLAVPQYQINQYHWYSLTNIHFETLALLQNGEVIWKQGSLKHKHYLTSEEQIQFTLNILSFETKFVAECRSCWKA